jgi:hypothetical protein
VSAHKREACYGGGALRELGGVAACGNRRGKKKGGKPKYPLSRKPNRDVSFRISKLQKLIKNCADLARESRKNAKNGPLKVVVLRTFVPIGQYLTTKIKSLFAASIQQQQLIDALDDTTVLSSCV